MLKSGAVLVKYKSNGKKFPRRFFLDEYEDFISYERSSKIFHKPHIYYIKDIDEIRTGFHAQTFDRLIKRGIIKQNNQNCAFSILYDNHRKEEHFIASDMNTRNLWVKGLQYLMNQYAQKGQYQLIREENWILELFHSADKNHSNTLSKHECRHLFANSLNVKIPDHIFEDMFNKVDKTDKGVLTSVEFVDLFNLLIRRKDLYEIMKKHVKNGYKQTMENIYMNRNELFEFLQQTQNQNAS
ncbi:unnamed protein product [Rotaria sordida]|uniref:phosphoinositide phospholipase C n=2 Tax=Rotaria sordida TaxID=392033 RepID=A0A814EEC2_9BILA|nr:unnamed protein product [Rotaria sordida]